MPQEDTQNHLRNPMISYFLLHTLLSTIFISTFTVHFTKPLEVVLIHLAVLTAANIVLIWFSHLLVRAIKNTATLRLTISTIFSIYWFVLLIIYTVNLVSNIHWGNSVLAGFYFDLYKHVDSFSRLKGFSALWSYALIAGVFLLLYFLILRYLSPIILKTRPTKNGLKIEATLLVISISYLWLLGTNSHLPGKWGGEPVTSSFSTINQRYNTDRSMRQRLADEIERKSKYPILNKTNKQTNVIFIIADALRADHLPVYGYQRNTAPFITQLSKRPEYQQINLFTSTCSESACGIMAALASRQFSDMGFGLYDMSDALKDAHYNKYFILSSNHAINSLSELYGNNHDIYVDGSSHWPKLSMYDDDSIILNMELIPEKKDNPAFFYFHFISTHELGEIKKENEKFIPYQKTLSELASFKPQKISTKKQQVLINGYDNGVYQFDRYLKKLFQILGQKGYMDDAIVIITSDHGEGLGEHGYFYHTYQLYQEDIHIPFIIYDTSNSCHLKELTYGTLIDIAPTVFDCLELPKINTWQGISLKSETTLPQYTFHQSFRDRQEFAIIKYDKDNIYKLMASKVRDDIFNYRLYELYSDPNETKDLIKSANTNLIKELKGKMLNQLESLEFR